MNVENVLNLIPLIEGKVIGNLFIIAGSVVMTILLIQISGKGTCGLIGDLGS